MTSRRLELVDLDYLLEAPRNPKNHDSESIGQSLKRFGYVELMVRDDRTGRLISGHGRRSQIMIARENGDAPPEGVEIAEDGRWLVPVVTGWASRDDTEAEAAIIALNRIGERGGWFDESLADMLSELADSPLGLVGVGYDQSDLDDLMALIQEGLDISFSDDRQTNDAAHAESSYDDWAENYRSKQIRSIVLDFSLDDYQRVVTIAADARKAFDVDSNAELFQRMLEEWAKTQ